MRKEKKNTAKAFTIGRAICAGRRHREAFRQAGDGAAPRTFPPFQEIPRQSQCCALPQTPCPYLGIRDKPIKTMDLRATPHWPPPGLDQTLYTGLLPPQGGPALTQEAPQCPPVQSPASGAPTTTLPWLQPALQGQAVTPRFWRTGCCKLSPSQQHLFVLSTGFFLGLPQIFHHGGQPTAGQGGSLAPMRNTVLECRPGLAHRGGRRQHHAKCQKIPVVFLGCQGRN